jgi:RNA polymerase sigma-70 factor (ECF subfamily)
MAVAVMPCVAFPADELVERARTDPLAFGELYDRHFAEIYGFVYRRVADQALAEDLTADVFFKALRKLSQYRNRGGPFVSWLYRIAANVVSDEFRNRRYPVQLQEKSAATGAGDLLDRIVRRDDERRAWQAIARLPRSQQMAMRLRFADDLSLTTIAGIMGRSPAAIKLLIHRAKIRVRRERDSNSRRLAP